MAKEVSIPGITLHVHGSDQSPCAGTEFLATGYITLTAEIRDFTIWDQVVEKLNGMDVYSVSTLTETLVEASRRRANKAEEDAMRVTEMSRARVDELESALSFRDAELEALKGQLAAAQEELTILRDFERTMNATRR